MKKYTAPTMNTVYFDRKDIITTVSGSSTYNSDIQGRIDEGTINAVKVRYDEIRDILVTF